MDEKEDMWPVMLCNLKFGGDEDEDEEADEDEDELLLNECEVVLEVMILLG